MRTAEVIAFYKSQKAIARVLGIKQPSVSVWGEYPPDVRQLQLEKLSKGTLKAEPGCKDRVLNPQPKARIAANDAKQQEQA